MLFAPLALAAGSVVAADWPSVPVPKDAKGEIVSDDMIYNGLRMRASRFNVPLPVDKVKAFYREEWGRGMIDTPHRGKSVLGYPTKDAKHYITVELTQTGSSTQGQIGVMELPKKPLPAGSIGAGFVRMPDTTVAEDIVYMDTPSRVRTLSMFNRYSPLQNSDFYARNLTSKGYVRQPAKQPCKASSSECVSHYVNGTKRITVASTKSNVGTVVIAVIE
jgi:hypothetical protein